MARENIWSLLQAAAKPELRKVFAAAHLRPCWLDTGRQPLLLLYQSCSDTSERKDIST